jgi:hypothetical protein
VEETLTETKVCVITRPTAFALTMQVLSCLVVLSTVICVVFNYHADIEQVFWDEVIPRQVLQLLIQDTEWIVSIVMIANTVIYSLFFRLTKKAVAYPSCAFVILCQAVTLAYSLGLFVLR